MSADEAKAALLAYNGEFKREMQPEFADRSTGPGTYPRGLSIFLMRRNPTNFDDTSSEHIDIAFSEFGSNPVLAVSRSMSFQREGRPSLDTFAKSMGEAYGMAFGPERTMSGDLVAGRYLARDGSPSRDTSCPRMAAFNGMSGTPRSLYQGFVTQSDCGAFIRVVAHPSDNSQILASVSQLLVDTQGLMEERQEAQRAAIDYRAHREAEEKAKASANQTKL